jgi:hypothetical protein
MVSKVKLARAVLPFCLRLVHEFGHEGPANSDRRTGAAERAYSQNRQTVF